MTPKAFKAYFSYFAKMSILLVQASRGTCSIVHWISPDCESSPGDLIRLSPCPGCAAHTPLPPSKKQNADLTLCTPTVFFTTFAYFADHQ
ncbi:hypothetical protein GLOIN_2v1783661 [Rhizophagus irregularis DAOM 181602=DAOM 197198]|nr:hypothetical protein GLOIN_2v1783661 [Rhizophagus irregularis DAOM 181602=DAOM 197198]